MGAPQVKSLTPFTTSWDDGSPLDARLGRLLTDFGLRGTFYATTGPSGVRTITDDALVRLADEHELGNHGRSHAVFTSLSDEEIRRELEWGARELSRFGQTSALVAPPRGKIDARVERLVAGLGYVVRTAPVLSSAKSTASRTEPTFLFFAQDWRMAARNIVRRRALPVLPLIRAWGFHKDLRSHTKDLIAAAINCVDVVHVWGHTEAIEQLDAWDVAHDIFEYVATLPIQPRTNGELFGGRRCD
jgi:peptidoglycan/xylan/chitin deacetylase (PgdA/CDA1 family)